MRRIRPLATLIVALALSLGAGAAFAEKDKPAAQEVAANNAGPKKLSRIEQRKRAALQKRVLLQQESYRQQDDARAKQRVQLQRQQLLTQDEQRHIQRMNQKQQDLAIRRLTQQPGAVPDVPRIGMGQRPMIESSRPSCGVLNAPVC